ncbi:MAG: hypothetical protein RI996_236 [Candidatus Parcubacteria bacterium]|jgi:tryptophan-rich sensory protein
MKAYAQVRGSRTESGSVASLQSTQQGKQTTSTQNQKPADAGPLLFIFFIVFALYAMVSAMLVYHWNRFGKNDKRIQFGQLVYFVITLLLLVIALFSIL